MRLYLVIPGRHGTMDKYLCQGFEKGLELHDDGANSRRDFQILSQECTDSDFPHHDDQEANFGETVCWDLDRPSTSRSSATGIKELKEIIN